jgi:hypothetical protein
VDDVPTGADLPATNAAHAAEVAEVAEVAEEPLEAPAPFPWPLDDGGMVSGHRPAPAGGQAVAEAPEHAWEAARGLVYPILRPTGTTGAEADVPLDVLRSIRANHTVPLVIPGPSGLVVSFALQGSGFDVLVNGEHLLSWGLDAAALEATAWANLAAWSAEAGWTDEISGSRRILSSDTGGGHDAARILLPEVRQHLARELTVDAVPGTRVVVGLPERHLLLAGALAPGDEEFAALFHEFVVEHCEDADEPIDGRLLELVDGALVEFAG